MKADWKNSNCNLQTLESSSLQAPLWSNDELSVRQ